MSVMKRVVLLLLLLVVAIGSNVAPASENCEGVNKRLPAKDLHKIFGDWVLVWSVSNYHILENISSSHIELRLHPNSKTMTYIERNMLHDKSCIMYFINVTLPSDSEHPTLHLHSIMLHRDGVQQLFNETAEVELYESCSDCLLLTCKFSTGKHFLLSYKREGSHQDVDELKAAHEDHQKKAECLGLPHDKRFLYDGAAGQRPTHSENR